MVGVNGMGPKALYSITYLLKAFLDNDISEANLQ